MLARLFAVDGRPIVPVLVLGRDELGDFDEGDRVGRTPDIDARDCINLRKSTPFSLTSCPCTSRLDMSIVVLDGAMDETCCGSAGTGGGAGSCWYFSLRPPVLIRFMSFHHFPPGESSSSRSLLPFVVFDARDERPSS